MSVGVGVLDDPRGEATFLYYKLIKKSIVENLLKIVYNTKEFALIAQQDRAVAS